MLTVVPEPVHAYVHASILGRAERAGVVQFDVVDLREFGEGRYKKLDDSPYGGGAGMVMKAPPVVRAIEEAQARVSDRASSRTILLSPAGRRLNRDIAAELATCSDIILVCGRYEGVGARVSKFVDEELSVGDFVLTGGELAALCVVDAVTRRLAGALGNETSAADESFESGLLEYPQYTRPETFRGEPVPAVLRSGDHGAIGRWRREQALNRTRERRADLLPSESAIFREVGEK